MKKMNRRDFVKNVGLATASNFIAPYILPSGRLFAPTGNRIANHVVYVLFAGGVRNEESVQQRYLADQGMVTEGNVMVNMLKGDAPTANLLYDPITPVLNSPLAEQGTLFQELHYGGPFANHFNGHAVAITGQNFDTGVNAIKPPEFPTVFEFYRKFSDPAKSALDAWWISNQSGPYTALNFSDYQGFGAQYGANFINANQFFGNSQFSSIDQFHPMEEQKISKVRNMLNNNFSKNSDLSSIQNSPANKELIKTFINEKITAFQNQSLQIASPNNDYDKLNNDLRAVSVAWEVLDSFAPELLVLNTSSLDICHSNFTKYIENLHIADFGIGWLWNKIQSHPVLANDTIMICIPEHGRNTDPNNIYDSNGLRAYDHGDYSANSNVRRIFSLVVGPPDKVKQNHVEGSLGNPVGDTVDMVPTIARILDFEIPSYLNLPGRFLEEAFIV